MICLLLVEVFMFYLQKLMQENKISVLSISKYLAVSYTYLHKLLHKQKDFNIVQLTALKELFIEKGIISKSFDICDFLDEV